MTVETIARSLVFTIGQPLPAGFRISGHSLRQTAFTCHLVLRRDFEKMDPYWLKVFERSEQYIKGALILQFCMRAIDKEAWHKSGLLDWQAPYFASINPLIDFAYSLKKQNAAHYSYFLYVYTLYKKRNFNRIM